MLIELGRRLGGPGAVEEGHLDEELPASAGPLTDEHRVDLAAGLGVVKQHAGSYAPGLWLFAGVALAASLCLVGVKQRWRLHWAAAGAARV